MATIEQTVDYNVTVDRLAAAIQTEPAVLLLLRTMTGLLRKEFAWTTKLVASPFPMLLNKN